MAAGVKVIEHGARSTACLPMCCPVALTADDQRLSESLISPEPSFLAVAVAGARLRDREEVERELAEVRGERRVFEVRVRQLQAELRLCEASQKALSQLEQRLLREAKQVAAASTTPRPSAQAEDDGANADVASEFNTAERSPDRGARGESRVASPSTGPVYFDMEEPGSEQMSEHGSGADAAEGGQSEQGGGGGSDRDDDYEEMLDHLGVARCAQCAVRLPLDVAAIEEHCQNCFAAPEEEIAAEEAMLQGKCAQCGEQILLSAATSHICPQGKKKRKSGLGSWWPKGSPSSTSKHSSAPPCPGSPL